jgi:cytochrome c7-like protein
MSALFPRWSNTAFRLCIATLSGGAIAGLVGLMIYVRTPWNTEQYAAVDQPVMFDHRHHVIDDQIDCIYCHANAEISDYAGVPATEVCMGCHAQIWNESPLLETVRRSYFSGKPIPWNRVHDLPDFVYFNHAVHVSGGVGCVACHGRVDEMSRVYKVNSLNMGFCLDCHQHAAQASMTPPDRTALGLRSPTSELVQATPNAEDSALTHEALSARRAAAQPALWGTFPVSVVEHDSLGPKTHDAFTTCSACHR